MATKKKNDLIWANEVMEVYKNLGTLPGTRDWSSPSAEHLFNFAMREENEQKFLLTMVPKATEIISKNTIEDVTEAVVVIDTKTIKDLKVLLRDALKECNTTEEKKVQALPVEVAKLEPKPEISLEDILG